MKQNILLLKDCYGCGVCVAACPKNIISLELNQDGFYSPKIHEPDKCIECGICLDICAFNHDEIANSDLDRDPKAYGCWSNDSEIRQDCTTAGLGFEIARNAISKGFKACVVKYNIPEERAEHIVVDSIAGLNEGKGSKYIPSFTADGFKAVNLKEKNVVFGLPCQIDSFRRFIRRFKAEDNFLLVDLLCHGTPSLLLWRNYLHELKDDTGEIEKVKFRSKIYGWHKSSCVEIDGENGKVVQSAPESDFYKLFFLDSCLNKCCHGKCKYKLLSSSADLRIGDYWGRKYKKNDLGVNVLVSFSQTGDEIVNDLQGRCTFQTSSLEDAMDLQMAHNAPETPFRKFALWGFRNHVPLGFIFQVIRCGMSISHPRQTLSKIINKLKGK